MGGSLSFASVKVFILIGLIATLYDHLAQRGPLLPQAEAGSKSSKASSKTTVIAIDGGGGGKAHPVPVPWPVVHCHHHHHHLKYVPKPVMVHHWVKKYTKPFEVEASGQEEYQVPIEEVKYSDHQHEVSEIDFKPTVARPNSKLPYEFMEGSGLISRLNDMFEQKQSHPFAFGKPLFAGGNSNSTSEARNQIELNKLRKMHQIKLGNKQLQLNKLAQTLASSLIRSNMSAQQSMDADSDESWKNIALANRTESTEASQENQTSHNNYEQFRPPEDAKGGHYFTEAKRSNANRKPSHPFDSPVDQMRDESQQQAAANHLVSNLNRANMAELSQASKVFERLAHERANRIRTLNAANYHARMPQVALQMMNPMQQIRLQPFKVQPQLMTTTGSFNRAISARVANPSAESNTIDSMTRLASQFAQNEAKKLLDKQKQQLRAEKQTNQTNKGEPKRPQAKGRKLLSLFSSALKGNKEKRRVSPTPIGYPMNLIGSKSTRFNHWQPAVSRNLDSTLRTFNLSPHLRLQEPRPIRTGGAGNSMLLESRPIYSDLLADQASNLVSKVADPSSSNRPTGEKSPKDSRRAHSWVEGSIAQRSVQKAAESTDQSSSASGSNPNTTTMSPEQESEFYVGQQEHLQAFQKQSGTVGHSASLRPNATRMYTSQPSNVHNSIVAPNRAAREGNETKSTVIQEQTNPDESMSQKSKSANESHDPQSNSNSVEGSREIAINDGQTLQQQLANQILAVPAYLEFPISPQQWSSEALKYMNQESSPAPAASSDNEAGTPSEEVQGEVGPSNQVDEAQGVDLAAAYRDPTLNQPLSPYHMLLGSGFQPQTAMATKHRLVFENSDQSAPIGDGFDLSQGGLFQMMEAQRFNAMQPSIAEDQLGMGQFVPLASYQSPAILWSGNRYFQPNKLSAPRFSLVPPKTETSPLEISSSLPQMMAPSMGSPSIGDPFKQTSGAESSSVYPQDEYQHSQSKLMPQKQQNPTYTSDLDGLGAINGLSLNTNQPISLQTAANDMRSLNQFHNSLSQSVNQANNITAMTHLSRQLRNQMQTLQGRLPSMPNIPQPPQIPNLPMPPPGIMQMAGLALPFAMARATRNNRIRNQQVNSAANGGGSSIGQRLFTGAANLSNRLLRPRRRPTSSPGNHHIPSRDPNKNRRRIFRLAQTVVDMRQRPAAGRPKATGNRLSATPALGAPKLRPKIDQVVKAKRLGRSVGWLASRLHEEANSDDSGGWPQLRKPTVIQPSSALATLTDGSLSRFASMTSPVDLLLQQLDRDQQRRPSASVGGRSVAYIRPEYSQTGGKRPEQTHSARPAQISSSYEPSLVREQPKLLPLPLVANHINLLLFSAQNVTGNLVRSKAKAAPAREREEAQKQAEMVASLQEEPPSLAPQAEVAGGDQLEEVANRQLEGQAKSERSQQVVQVVQQPETASGDERLRGAEAIPTESQLTTDREFTAERDGRRESAKVQQDLHRPEASNLAAMFVSKLAPTHLAQDGPRSMRANQNPFTVTPTTTLLAKTRVLLPLAAKVGPKKSESSARPQLKRPSHKSKRSTTRPSEPETRPQQSSSPSEGGKETSLVSSSDNYVRAIKLVREIAIPWPPPTKSSKSFESSTSGAAYKTGRHLA